MEDMGCSVCRTDSHCDDGEACTVDACVVVAGNIACRHTLVANASTVGCDGYCAEPPLGCVACRDASHCPAVGTACASAVCNGAGVCGFTLDHEECPLGQSCFADMDCAACVDASD